MLPKVSACVDQPQKTDFEFFEVFGASYSLPSAIYNTRTTVYDQSIDPETEYACTWYSARHCINEGNAIESENKHTDILGQDDPKNKWGEAIKRGAIKNKGWTLQGAQKMALDLGYIAGYTRCVDVESIKNALIKQMLIQTGSNKIDWKLTWKNNNIAVPGESYGHAFMLEGYDDSLHGGSFIMRNSYGAYSGQEGRFFVRYEDFDVLYSCYAFTDKDDSETIRKYQSKKRRQTAIDRGIWNGKRENDWCTRYEAAQIAMRATDRTSDRGIYNGLNKGDPCTRYEAVRMLQLGSNREFSFTIGNLSGKITRGEMAELSVRI